MGYPQRYLKEVVAIAQALDPARIDALIEAVVKVRDAGGRLFFLGVGGSAANCSHAVNDFRKLAGIESYAPSDNVAELTARTNDEGWETVFAEYLRVSRLSDRDGVFVMSVGGGNEEKRVSVNLVRALQFAQERGAQILGIVGRDGGYTAKVAHACVVIPTQSPETVTPHAEAWQGTVWHLMVSDPRLQRQSNKWEGITKKT
jgi:D-sedoheptulose 7-phosphate isomerase